jgi:diaminopimelate epimerase
MRFTKMHGIGNDFVVLDGTAEPRPDPETVTEICHRHFGIGADGVLYVTPNERGARMEYWNADGSIAEMCGNGLRCTAWFAHRAGWVGETFEVLTERGWLPAEIVGDHRVRVALGSVSLGDAIEVEGSEARSVDVGNPHLVVEVGSVAEVDVPGIGARMDAAMPGGVNTGFFERVGSGIRLRVHERGVGETLACGSGAVAAAAVALGGEGSLDVHLPGGRVHVEVAEGRSWLTGPVAESFVGEWAG